MKDCCDNKLDELSGHATQGTQQSRTLKIVLIINLIMFFVEIIWGYLSQSTALMADSLDMFGDALIYGMSLYVVHKGLRAKAKVALVKGLIMLALSLLILGEAVWKFFKGDIPNFEMMGIVGAIALGANLVCLFLLFKHRKEDINMQSTWLCSRNDILANTSVLVAALLVYLFNSNLPDVLIGLALAGIIISSSWGVIFRAYRELKTAKD